MPSVFISYARDDEAMAERVAGLLANRGYEVLRDNALPAHRPYAEVIEEWLAGADAVLVLWSAAAARSQWVRAEADVARNRSCLVQASLDGSVPPLPFNQIQCANLAGWDGEDARGGWETVEASLASLAGTPASGQPARPERPRGLSICVLPFQNMSGDAEQEYFSDGISEDITTDLSQISALQVIARNTAFTFKGQSVDVAEVARSLGVSHVLEGSVRKAGNRVRISAQLIDGESGGQVWAQRFDRDLDDIFAIQDEISKAIVDALKVRLLPEEKEAIERRGTTSAEAYNLYLKARNYWVTGNHGDRGRERRVIELCKRAVEIDPDYAEAWALLSIAQSNLHFGFGEPCDDGVAAAERALALDPTLAGAYCARARALREAGRFEEARNYLESGLSLDPDSWDLNKATANFLMSRGLTGQALPHFERAAEILDTDYHAWGMLYSCYRALGNRERALEAARKSLEETERVLADDPGNGAAISFAVTALAALGEVERAKELMERALVLDPDNLNMRYNFACTLAAELGDREGALQMVERSILESKGSLGNAEFDPDLEIILDDPRYQAMIAKAKQRLSKFKDCDGGAPAD